MLLGAMLIDALHAALKDRIVAFDRKHPVNNAAREALGRMVGPRLMTKAGLL
jgi:hypothetical protein